MTSTGAAIWTHGLTKHYGDVEALVDLDLEVATGAVSYTHLTLPTIYSV